MAKEMILQSTSLSKEIGEIMKILQSNKAKHEPQPIDISSLKPTKAADLIQLENFHIQRLAIDVHPVVKFKHYFDVFGSDL